MTTSEKVAYLKGLCEGMGIGEDSKEGKLLKVITDILEDLSLEQYQSFHELFGEDVFEAISLRRCVESRISAGSTSVQSVEIQINYIEKFI